MKKIIFSFLILSTCTLSAGSNYWKWAMKQGGISADEANGIAIDQNRNSFVCGNFTGNATFGSTNLTSSGGTDACLSKIDEDGNYVWSVKVGGGTGNENAVAVACIPGGGEIYVTGTFSGTATFGTSTILTSSGDLDVFVARYNSSGTLQWVVKAGGPYLDVVNDLAWIPVSGGSRSSNIYITGTFITSMTFGTTTLTSVNYADMYTASYSDAGTFQWANQASASSTTIVPNSITADASNNVYVTGGYYGTGTFGSVTLASGTSKEQFLVKYNSSGVAQWAKKGAGMSEEEGMAVCMDASGNVYVAGNFTSSTTTFGSYSVNNTNSGTNDISMVKYNSSGTEQWAKKGGGNADDLAKGIAIDPWGNIYMTGTFQSSLMYFGTISFGGDCPTDGYVVKADPSGNFTEVSSPTGLTVPPANYPHIYPNDIAVSALGHVFVAGTFDVKFDFVSTIILSNGSTDGFVARLKPSGWPVAEGSSGGGPSYDVILNMDADASGYTYVTGAFQGTLTIGNTILVPGNANHNMFLIKYDQLGQPVWAKKGTVTGFTQAVYGTAVAADASGNVYVAGEYSGPPTFESTTLSGTFGIFLNKYNSSGSLVWSVKAATQCELEDLALDASGNVYLTGNFFNTTTFGTGGGAVAITATGTSKDGYIAKFDNSGNIVWAVNAVTTSGNADFCYGIAVNGSNIFVVGSYSANGTIAGTSVTYAGGATDMYIAKYSTSGTGLGVFTASSANAEALSEIATTGGNIYVTGDYTGSLTFGSTSLTSSGSRDALLAKLPTSLSSVTWIREVKGSWSQSGSGVDVSGTGVYVSGSFVNSTTFGDGVTSPVIVPYGADVFVEKFDQNGNYQWVSTIERDGYGGPRVAIDGSNNAYVAGLFINHLAIGPYTYSTPGDENFFIQKFSFDDGQAARFASEETQMVPVNPISVYPNPFSDVTTFAVPEQYEGNYTLYVYDINGREAARQSGTVEGNILFSKQDLIPGLYTYRLVFDTEKPATGKLIVQ